MYWNAVLTAFYVAKETGDEAVDSVKNAPQEIVEGAKEVFDEIKK